MYGRTLNSYRFARLSRTSPGDGGAGGGGGQQQGQQQGGQQQGQNGPALGLLDGLANGDGGDGSAGDQGGSGDQGQGAGAGGPLTVEAMQTALTQALATVPGVVEAAIDRRINTRNNGGRTRRQNRQNQGQQNEGQQNADGGQNLPDVEPGVDVQAVREARMSAKEYLTDQIRFVDPAERAVANRLLNARVADWDGDGDADVVGQRAAADTAAEIRSLRTKYEELLMRQLRKRGLIVEPNGQQGAPGAGSGGATFPTNQNDSVTQAVTGAQGMAAQWNQNNGHQAPAQAAAAGR